MLIANFMLPMETPDKECHDMKNRQLFLAQLGFSIKTRVNEKSIIRWMHLVEALILKLKPKTEIVLNKFCSSSI